MNIVTSAALVGLLSVGLYFLQYIAPRRSYPVHTSGAIVITGASSGIGTGIPLHCWRYCWRYCWQHC